MIPNLDAAELQQGGRGPDGSPPDQRTELNRAEPEELELRLDELEDDLEDELDEDLDDELLDDELDDGLDDELDGPALDELDGESGLEEEPSESSGPTMVPWVHACSSSPRPTRAAPPERIRRNCRRSSRPASCCTSE